MSNEGPMKVKDLLEVLSHLDPERVVILSKDSEGNGHSPLAALTMENCNYSAESTWHGNIGLEKITDELREQGYSEDDVIEGEKCIVLWPTN